MKKKSLLIAALSLLAVAAIAVGSTFAWLSNQTGPVKNTFTVSQKGITIDLKEPAWDNQTFDGTGTIPAADLGQTKAQNIVPGRVIPKDPQVKNTCDHAAWVAIKLDYTMGGAAATFENLAKQVSLDFTDAWVAKDAGNTVFYYKTTLAAGDVTTKALFNNVTVVNTPDMPELQAFDITITAYAVQAEGVADLAAAKPLLDKLIAGQAI